MKFIPEFEYFAVSTIKDTCNIMKEKSGQVKILAGGTDLLISLKKGDIAPRYIIDISQIPALRHITIQDDSICFGAATTIAEIARHKEINQEVFFLCEAANTVGSQQIRNAATIGGNLVNASPAADTVPPLVALDTQIKIIDANKERWENLSDFLLSPYKTILKNDELIAELKFKKFPEGTGTCFIKLGRRKALAISVASVAVTLNIGKDGRIEAASIVPGSVLPVPMRIRKAEESLLGERPEERIFESAGKVVSEEMINISGRRLSTDYKEPVIKNLVQRALVKAAGRCKFCEN